MRLLRHLQHWLSGSGPRLQVAAVVPPTHSIRQWTDTFPWVKMVEAVEQSFARRFPKRAQGGRHPGEWPPLRQAASARVGLGSAMAGAVTIGHPRLSHCWPSQAVQS